MFYNKLIVASTYLALIFSSLAQPAYSLEVETTEATLEECFTLSQMKIKTFNMKQTINFKVRYQIDSLKTDGIMPDIHLIKNCALQFFVDYEPTRDYWELINKKLVHHLLDQFPAIKTLETEIEILPGKTFPYLRSSIYKFDNNEFKDIFWFEYYQDKVEAYFTKAIINVRYTYIKDINPEDYVDFVFLKADLDLFLEANWIETESWDAVKPTLTQHLLKTYPTLEKIEISLNAK